MPGALTRASVRRAAPRSTGGSSTSAIAAASRGLVEGGQPLTSSVSIALAGGAIGLRVRDRIARGSTCAESRDRRDRTGPVAESVAAPGHAAMRGARSTPMVASAESERRTLAMSLAMALPAIRDSAGGVVGEAGIEDASSGGARTRRQAGPGWPWRPGCWSGRRPRSRPASRPRRRGRTRRSRSGPRGDLMMTEVTIPPTNRPTMAPKPIRVTARRTRDADDQPRATTRALRRAVIQRSRAGRAVEDVRIRLADGDGFGGPSGSWPGSRPRRSC